ncbi:MAG: hypothetical protein ACPGRE_05880 [Flavobacteriaceae bacterium]
MRNLITFLAESFTHDLNNFQSKGSSYLDLHGSKRFSWNRRRQYRYKFNGGYSLAL